MTAVAWRRALQKEALGCLLRAISRHLAAAATTTTPPDVSELVLLLQNAVGHDLDVKSTSFMAYLQHVFDVMMMQGPGADFQLVEEFVTATDIAIDKIAAAGGSVADLLLAQAEYYARISNRDPKRYEAIRRAVNESSTSAERLKSLIILATYHIDGSDYRKAHKALDECVELASLVVNGGLHLPEISLTRGIAYVYSDPSRADACFERAISLGQQHLSVAEVRNAVRAAWNYRGRLYATQGKYAEALRCLVKAREYALGRLADAAFFHLRMAEILMDHGPSDQALYHLEQSKKIFDQAQDMSLGTAQYDSALARYYLREGDRATAETLLKGCIQGARDDPFPRGELKFLIELAQVQIARFKLTGAALTLGRAIFVLCVKELPSGRIFTPSKLRALARFAPRILRVPPFIHKERRESLVITCPCGADHDLPVR